MNLLLILLVTLGFTISSLGAEPEKGYYRFPELHGDVIVFSAEGDLWTVSVEGGTARRLTTHPGQETHPAVSPDGKTIAFDYPE